MLAPGGEEGMMTEATLIVGDELIYVSAKALALIDPRLREILFPIEAVVESPRDLGAIEPIPCPYEGIGGRDIVCGISDHPSQAKLSGFDFASANQTHLKSIASMRRNHAGPVKKPGPRR